MKLLKHLKNKNTVHSIKTQLILFFTVFSLCVIGIGSYFTYANITNTIEKQNEKYFMLLFRQSEYNIRSLMSETDRVMKNFILDVNVKRFIETNSFGQSYEDTEMLKGVLAQISNYLSNYIYINSIYLYTENKGEIGRNRGYNLILRAGEEDTDFFNSDICKNARSSYPRITWEGLHVDRDYNPRPFNDVKSVFSAVRAIASTLDNTKKSIWVFNINESAIAELYAGISQKGSGTAKISAGNPNSNKENIFIVDKSGRIISSNDSKNIGSESPVISYINAQEGKQGEEGSFTSKIAGISIQTVYYKLKDTDWYLVGEIPFQLFSGDFTVLQRIFVLVFLSTIVVIIIVSFFWLGKITEPLKVLAKKMHDMSSGKLGLTFSKVPKNELGIVIKRFNEMSLSIVDLIKKNEEIQDEKRKVEIEALQYQINPHFFYNTLNMIKWMAMMTKSKNIVESIVCLGNLIRPAFKNMEKMCTLNEEKNYIVNYLKIMNLRFGNGINLDFHVPDDLENCKVPRFILQPVVENSITHGMKRPENSINICIEALLEDDYLFVIVSDDGVGIGEDQVKEINAYLNGTDKEKPDNEDGSIGLYNVNRRISLNFGQEYGLQLESREGEGTMVRIKLPVNKK